VSVNFFFEKLDVPDSGTGNATKSSAQEKQADRRGDGRGYEGMIGPSGKTGAAIQLPAGLIILSPITRTRISALRGVATLEEGDASSSFNI